MKFKYKNKDNGLKDGTVTVDISANGYNKREIQKRIQKAIENLNILNEEDYEFETVLKSDDKIADKKSEIKDFDNIVEGL